MLRCQVDFANMLRPWDGFGVNYVEVAQTRDYATAPQDYGGFSILAEQNRQAILDLIFGDDGLRPGIVKLFLDPFHQPDPILPAATISDCGEYDHTTTTRWMRMFAREGLKRTRARGGDLQMFATLYGPPAWMTRQRVVRGRDLDPAYAETCARYLIDWARYLRREEGLPLRYLSLHNEGEDWERWPADGAGGDTVHDHNMYWPPEQVTQFLKLMRPLLDASDLHDVGLAPGETTNWYRFAEWGYADAIADDPEALNAMGLITSHGFSALGWSRWYADWRSAGIDLLRDKRPELRAWVTSTSWSNMDVFFVNELRQNIYGAKVNAIVPWAAIQRRGLWVGGDPNPGTAIVVHEDGSYTIQPGYHFYKQVCRAGQPGMAVARVQSNDSLVGLIGFARNGTAHPDALIVLNLADEERRLPLTVLGSDSRSFDGYRSAAGEQYVAAGTYALTDQTLAYVAPPRSVTTFYSQE